MIELVRENWVFLVLALLVGLFIAWWLFASRRRTRVEVARSDEKEGPARRNQALIDAPPATAVPDSPPPTPEALAGVGEAIAASATSSSAAPAHASAAGGSGGDDLTRIKGVGPKLVEQLRALGVTRFDQIAGWSEEEIDRIDAKLGRFAGRIRRDSWVEQARFLAAGDTAGYEGKFGKL
jgi:predicted flap endonuclease-1-like 5' DNA nuclease